MCAVCIEAEAVVQEAMDAHPLRPWPDTSESFEFFDYVNARDLPPFHLYGNTSHPFASAQSKCPHLFDDANWQRELHEQSERSDRELEDLAYDCDECQLLATAVIERLELSEGAKRRAEQEWVANVCRCDGCERARRALPEGIQRGSDELDELRRSGAPYFHVIHEHTGWVLGLSELTKTECPHNWDDELWSSMVEDDLRGLINCVECETRYENAAHPLASANQPEG